MGEETIIFQPLEDAPAPTGYVPDYSLLREGLEVRAAMEGLMGGGEFAAVEYPLFLERLGAALRRTPEALLDEPWRIRSSLLEAGFASAPDSVMERSRLKPHDKIVLYRTETAPPAVRTRPYKRALVFVKFLTLMLPDLSPLEAERAGECIDLWVKAPKYRRHLRGMLRWYATRRRLLDQRTKRLAAEIFPPGSTEAETLASALLGFASARGLSLPAKSLWQLDRLLQLLGHEPGAVHSLLHRTQCLLPAHRSDLPPTEAPALMDAGFLAHVEEQTAQVQRMLSDIFEEEPEEPAEIAPAQLPPLLAEVLQREEWEVSALEALARERGVALWPALEAINDFSVGKTGETVVDIEGGTAYVAVDLAAPLLA